MTTDKSNDSVETSPEKDLNSETDFFDVPVQKENRYVAVIDFYVYAHSDAEAIEKAKAICRHLDNKEDNNATLQTLVEQPYATFGNREIKL